MGRIRVMDTEPFRKKHTSTSTGGTRRRQTAAEGAVSAKKVKSIIDAQKETYVKSTALAGAEISTTVTFNDLTAIAQGDDHDQRRGDAVKLKRAFGRIEVARDDNATADSFDNIRLILFVWHPDDDADGPSDITDILESSTSPHLQPYQLEKSKSKKFTILWDRIASLCPREGGRTKDARVQWNFSKRIKSNAYFNDAVTTGRNKVYLMRVGSYAAGADNSLMNAYINIAYKQK